MPESFLLVALWAGLEVCLLLTGTCKYKPTENSFNGTFHLGCVFLKNSESRHIISTILQTLLPKVCRRWHTSQLERFCSEYWVSRWWKQGCCQTQCKNHLENRKSWFVGEGNGSKQLWKMKVMCLFRKWITDIIKQGQTLLLGAACFSNQPRLAKLCSPVTVSHTLLTCHMMFPQFSLRSGIFCSFPAWFYSRCIRLHFESHLQPPPNADPASRQTVSLREAKARLPKEGCTRAKSQLMAWNSTTNLRQPAQWSLRHQSFSSGVGSRSTGVTV